MLNAVFMKNCVKNLCFVCLHVDDIILSVCDANISYVLSHCYSEAKASVPEASNKLHD